MTRRNDDADSQLDRDLAELKLLEIAKSYHEVLDEAAREGSSSLEVLRTLIGMEAAARHERALARRIREARLPPLKTLADYDFNFPRRQKGVRESAGLNRLRVVDERAIRGRTSHSPRPRVLRWRWQHRGCGKDRGTRRPAIELRNHQCRVPTLF